MNVLWLQTLINAPDWLICSHCATLVKPSVYGPDFLSRLSLLLLPLALLAILVWMIYDD